MVIDSFRGGRTAYPLRIDDEVVNPEICADGIRLVPLEPQDQHLDGNGIQLGDVIPWLALPATDRESWRPSCQMCDGCQA